MAFCGILKSAERWHSTLTRGQRHSFHGSLIQVLGNLGRHREAEEVLAEALSLASDYPLRPSTSRAYITALMVTHIAEEGEEERALAIA